MEYEHPESTIIANTVVSLYQNNGNNLCEPKNESLLLNRYRFENNDKIGEGSFGKIYKAYDTHLNRYVAIKIESNERSQLPNEGIIYELLMNKIPNWNKGQLVQCDNRNMLIMDLLGPNIDMLFKEDKNKPGFTPAVVAYLAVQMLERIQQFHSIGYIHRDIKPQNFVLQRLPHTTSDEITLNPKVYLVDYGLSVPYMKDNDHHKDFSKHAGVHGTMRYCSINTHFGVEQSRRDDLISIAYTVLYLAGARIPWKYITQHQSKQRNFYQIMISKMKTPIETLCLSVQGEALQRACIEYLMYVLSLAYDESPDYDYCASIFFKTLN